MSLNDYVENTTSPEDSSSAANPTNTIFKNGQLVQRIVLDNKNTSEIEYYPFTTFDNVKGKYNEEDVSLTETIEAIDKRWNDAFNTDSIALGPSAKKNSFGISLGQNAGAKNSITYNFEFDEDDFENSPQDSSSSIYTFTLWNVLVHCRPINIGVWIVGYSRDDSLSVHYLDIYRTVRFGGCTVHFYVQIETVNTTFCR